MPQLIPPLDDVTVPSPERLTDKPKVEPATIVKLDLEIAKNMLLLQATFILANVVAVLGTVTTDDPLFETELASKVGNVNPPSVDNDTLTAEQLTGAESVLATFQVTLWAVPPFHVTAVFGAVT